jgi:hypothetical protein
MPLFLPLSIRSSRMNQKYLAKHPSKMNNPRRERGLFDDIDD